ncbi:alpha/beta fold hydrolase [Phaeobacter sp. 11ANDIMAR09]|uniref:alpha/beta fold hydrolase n=1 Tax=Phaeobacter sp. 11ANDIMAR09 TaxID=1225647 RepID=UPI000AEE9626
MALAKSAPERYHCAMLNYILHGSPTDKPALLVVHGLYGSARNWGVICKRLSDERQVVAVDLRNHGQSPWTDSHSYTEMAEDLAEVIEKHGGQMDVIGHSMGGKAAMMLALNHPEMVHRLIVADIAPVTYTHSQIQFIEAMKSVDFDRVERRPDVEVQLAEAGVEPALQSFFTQSLDIPNRGWRLNLDTLARHMPDIMSFPQTTAQWPGAVLFLSGANSDYVLREHRTVILPRFPNSRFAKIPGAGHWLHAEKPREFEANARAFLNA